MNLELDHVFILVEPQAKVADLLVELGLAESFSREHKGQGTTNRRFEFDNGMLEFLWIRDEHESITGPAKKLLLSQRANNNQASPFGLVVKRKDDLCKYMPFDGFEYQPDYFKAPMSFHIGDDASNINAPLCIYVPFFTPKIIDTENVPVSVDTKKERRFKKMTQVNIQTVTDQLSHELIKVDQSDRLSIQCSDQHVMELFLDDCVCGQSKDFRPDIPLILHW